MDSPFASVTIDVVKSSKCIRYSAIGSVHITMFVVFAMLVSFFARGMLEQVDV